MPPGSRFAQALARFADQIGALAVFAALLGLVAPSRALARHSDLLLAGLVAFTALGVALLPMRDAAAVALPIALRDFAVAAAIAGQAFGPSSATVAGVYGVLMLIAGAGAATALRSGASS